MLFEKEAGGNNLWRSGWLNLPRGRVPTPIFMPVGTRGTVKALSSQDLEELGVKLLLANTYHLHLRPGSELIARCGGLHQFMGWDGNILTDSGGFQVFSLKQRCRISEEGVTFRSHLDGSPLALTPEETVAIQLRFGSDIIMPLDECVGYPAPRETVRAAMERSLRWAARARACRIPAAHCLFGIVQGGMVPEFRRENAQALREIGFAGYAVGGLSVGEPKELMQEVLEVTVPELPAEAPRYLMGVGTPVELWRAVGCGIDMFDCVLPTRDARHGTLFTGTGSIHITNARFSDDCRPVEEDCDCLCCRHYTRAYLRHLLRSKEMLGQRLASIHNISFLMRMMEQIRKSIREERFEEAKHEFIAKYNAEKGKEK